MALCAFSLNSHFKFEKKSDLHSLLAIETKINGKHKHKT